MASRGQDPKIRSMGRFYKRAERRESNSTFVVGEGMGPSPFYLVGPSLQLLAVFFHH